LPKEVDTLNLGGTGEKPNGKNTVVANYWKSDLADVPADTHRICCDGGDLPFADGRFKHVQGNYLPPDMSAAPRMVKEGFRVLEPGGTARFSSSGGDMAKLMTDAGFVDV